MWALLLELSSLSLYLLTIGLQPSAAFLHTCPNSSIGRVSLTSGNGCSQLVLSSWEKGNEWGEGSDSNGRGYRSGNPNAYNQVSYRNAAAEGFGRIMRSNRVFFTSIVCHPYAYYS